MAGRLPKPWYRADRGAWYVVLDGMRVALGKDRDEAFRKFHRLMSGEELPAPAGRAVGAGGGQELSRSVGGVARDAHPPLTFGELVPRYLTALRKRVRVRTYYVATYYLNPFVAKLAAVPAAALAVEQVDDVIAEHGKWNQTSEHHIRCRLMAVFNWAVAAKLIPVNPLAGMKKPRAVPRGAAAAIDADTAAKLIAASPPYLRDVLTALQQTGARPCEVLTVTAAEYDRRAAVWVLNDHKTAHQTDAVRVIYLTPAVVAICDRLAELHPSGPLFRRASGKPFPEGYYLARLVRAVRERLELPASVIPYGFRHGFATESLAAGVPDALVAELIGHRGTAMLHKHYAHLVAKSAALREALGRVRGGTADAGGARREGKKRGKR